MAKDQPKKQVVGEPEARFTVRCPKSDAECYKAFAEQKGIPVTTLFTDAVDFYIEQHREGFPPTIEQESIHQLRQDMKLLMKSNEGVTESVNTLLDAFYRLSQGDDLQL